MPRSGNPLFITIIDYNEELCRGWRAIFGLSGHAVCWYTSGAQALDARYYVSKSDLVLCDYYLPDIDGVSLIAKLREIKPMVPAIIITGSADQNIRAEAEKLPLTRLLQKPLKVDALEIVIGEILNQAQKSVPATPRSQSV